MFYSVMDPHRSFSNSIVKGYSGEDTERGAFWENNTMSKFFKQLHLIKAIYISGLLVQKEKNK